MHGTALCRRFSAMHTFLYIWGRLLEFVLKNPAKTGFCSFLSMGTIQPRRMNPDLFKVMLSNTRAARKNSKAAACSESTFLCIKQAEVSFGYECLRWLLKESNLALNCHCASCWGPSTKWLLSAFLFFFVVWGGRTEPITSTCSAQIPHHLSSFSPHWTPYELKSYLFMAYFKRHLQPTNVHNGIWITSLKSTDMRCHFSWAQIHQHLSLKQNFVLTFLKRK